jgi:hypothetical protein
MLKTITFLLTIIILTASTAVGTAATEKQSQSIVIALNSSDMRVKALENVFARYRSPLAPYAGAYVRIADKYEVDWKLLPAIAGLESSFGKAQLPDSNNSYGWGGGRIYFKSVDEGIETVLSGLKNRYISRGATTVETIAPIYSESHTWAPRVRRFMNEIDAEYQKMGINKLALTI